MSAGRIDRVSPQGKAKKDDVVGFETLIDLEAPGPIGSGSESDRTPLRPGMSVTVEIEVRKSDSAPSVPAQAGVRSVVVTGCPSPAWTPAAKAGTRQAR